MMVSKICALSLLVVSGPLFQLLSWFVLFFEPPICMPYMCNTQTDRQTHRNLWNSRFNSSALHYVFFNLVRPPGLVMFIFRGLMSSRPVSETALMKVQHKVILHLHKEAVGYNQPLAEWQPLSSQWTSPRMNHLTDLLQHTRQQLVSIVVFCVVY